MSEGTHYYNYFNKTPSVNARKLESAETSFPVLQQEKEAFHPTLCHFSVTKQLFHPIISVVCADQNTCFFSTNN